MQGSHSFHLELSGMRILWSHLQFQAKFFEEKVEKKKILSQFKYLEKRPLAKLQN